MWVITMIRNLLFGTPFVEAKNKIKWVWLGMEGADKNSNTFKPPSYNKKSSEKATEKIKKVLKNG